MMNRTLFMIVLSVIISMLYACNDNNTETIAEVKPVSNVRFEAGAGEITFRWDNPVETELAYVGIYFQTDDSVKRKVLVGGKLNSQRVYGLPDSKEREYTFIAYNSAGVASVPVTTKAKADVTPFDALLDGVSVGIKLEGVDVTWNNTHTGEFYIDVSYKNQLGVENTTEIVIKEQGEGSQFIELAGVLESEVILSSADEYGNKSLLDKTVRFKRLENGNLDRKIWKVADFSTEEAGGEGAWPQGYAAALLDGNPTTFWHSKWSNSYPARYPHYVTFDLGRVVQLKSAQIVRRLNNANLNTFEIQGGPTKNGPWTKIKEYVILPNNNPQTIPFSEPVEYRFIRLYCTVGGGGNVHASMAEFMLYGQDLED